MSLKAFLFVQKRSGFGERTVKHLWQLAANWIYWSNKADWLTGMLNIQTTNHLTYDFQSLI